MNALATLVLLAVAIQGALAAYGLVITYTTSDCTGEWAYYNYLKLDSCFGDDDDNTGTVYSNYNVTFYQVKTYPTVDCSGDTYNVTYGPLDYCSPNDGYYEKITASIYATPLSATGGIANTRASSCSGNINDVIQRFGYNPTMCFVDDDGATFKYATCTESTYTVHYYETADCSGDYEPASAALAPCQMNATEAYVVYTECVSSSTPTATPAPGASTTGTTPAPGTSTTGTTPAPGTSTTGTTPAPGTSTTGTTPAPGTSTTGTTPAPGTSTTGTTPAPTTPTPTPVPTTPTPTPVPSGSTTSSPEQTSSSSTVAVCMTLFAMLAFVSL